MGSPIHRRPPRFSTPSACPLRLLTDLIRLLHTAQNGESVGRRASNFFFFLLENTAPFVCSSFKFSNSLHRVQLLLDFASTLCYLRELGNPRAQTAEFCDFSIRFGFHKLGCTMAEDTVDLTVRVGNRSVQNQQLLFLWIKRQHGDRRNCAALTQ